MPQGSSAVRPTKMTFLTHEVMNSVVHRNWIMSGDTASECRPKKQTAIRLATTRREIPKSLGTLHSL